MPWTHLHRWIGAALCVLLAGCTPCDLVQRTIRREPSAFWWKSDRERSRATYGLWADEAWQQEGSSCAGEVSGPEYEAGFKDGFVDYVFAGGTGEPPPLPPRGFWNMDLRLPAGRERANQWFAGYRHGSRVARESGYRALAQVQTSLSGPPTYGPHPAGYSDQLEMDGAAWPQSQEFPDGQMVPSTDVTPNSAEPLPTQSSPPKLPRGGPSASEPIQTTAPPGPPVDELDRSLKSVPAPEDIRLPSLERRPSGESRPAAVPHEPSKPNDGSATRIRPLRLTSNPQFEW